MTIVQFIKRIWNYRDRIKTVWSETHIYAGALTYYTIIGIIPLCASILYVFEKNFLEERYI